MRSTSENAQFLGAEIGAKVRHHRKKAGLSGVKLATAAGVSQPFLSQLESGTSSVAIATLYRIANALGVAPTALLPAAAQREIEVVRSADTQRMDLSDHLSSATAKVVFRGGTGVSEFYDYKISPDDYIEDWFSSDSEQTLYVLTGSLRVQFEDSQDYVLEAGDLIFYDGLRPHRWRALEGVSTRIILFIVNR